MWRVEFEDGPMDICEIKADVRYDWENKKGKLEEVWGDEIVNNVGADK